MPVPVSEKADNLEVRLQRMVSVDEMQKILDRIAADASLHISHITTLGRRKYPGNRHWHFKQNVKSKGCLDITYWPEGELMWITMRNYEPEWVHAAGRVFKRNLEKALRRTTSD